MPIYGTFRVIEAVKAQFPYAFVPEDKRYPGAPELVPIYIESDKSIEVSGIRITPLPVKHGEWPVLGYRIGDFSYITDANFIPDETFKKLNNTKCLVLNALRRQAHYSHFTIDEAVEVARRVGAEYTFFTHISHDLGLHDEVSAELPAGMYLAYDGLAIDV